MATTIREAQAPSREDMVQAADASDQLTEGTLDLKAVPALALKLFGDILHELAQGHRVELRTVEEYLSTNEAADFLNVSRPYVIKLLNEGKLPFQMVGTHRRIRYDELLEYKRKQDERSYELMAELQAEAQEMNMGYE